MIRSSAKAGRSYEYTIVVVGFESDSIHIAGQHRGNTLQNTIFESNPRGTREATYEECADTIYLFVNATPRDRNGSSSNATPHAPITFRGTFRVQSRGQRVTQGMRDQTNTQLENQSAEDPRPAACILSFTHTRPRKSRKECVIEKIHSC